MGRTARDKRPYVPPVQKIELNARHTKVRLALAVLFFALGIGLIVFSLNGWLSSEPGWAEIEASTSDLSCADDFTFLYPLGTNGSPTVERKALTLTYSDACVAAYRLFTVDSDFEGVNNLRSLNLHPNEVLTLEPALYRALGQIVESGDRSFYLAPIREVYDNIFYCQDPAQTADFDPRQNDELRAWFEAVCAYVGDPAQVNIELLGDNRARLFVSDEYLAFAQAEEIGRFIDLGWMRNAFVADYLAGQLNVAGYRIGTLSSCDGFMRNLDEMSDADYAVNLLNRDGTGVYAAATLHYSGARAIVSLLDFPLSAADANRYYVLADGSIRTAMLSPADGLCRAAVPSLTAYSTRADCAEIALRLAPVYIADELDRAALAQLSQDGIDSIAPIDGSLVHTQQDIALTDLSDGYRQELLVAP